MKIFLTNKPAFYKINLYNELSQRTKILVLFSKPTDYRNRNVDFFSGVKKFDSVNLYGNLFVRFRQLFRILRTNEYEELIIGGWQDMTHLLAAFLSPMKKNALVVESSDFESTHKDIKGVVKRIFIRRIHKVYASGKSQARLVKNLGFGKEIKITGGCGLLNYIPQPSFEQRAKVKNFLYVGRLAKEKNLQFLIEVFNTLPAYSLTIVGYGELESELKSIAKENIQFVGSVNNTDLPDYYQKADVFVLPSISEPWGLVVEEALNNGCPVIVSNKVGCREDLVKEEDTGFVFDYNDHNSLYEAVNRICNLATYNRMREVISHLDFSARKETQIHIYL